MGFDEENLEPKPRKLNKKNSTVKEESPQTTFAKSYCVIFGKEKRQVSAFSRCELLKNITEKFGIDDFGSFKIEFWSNVFQEWILLEDQLPDANSKLQIIECPKKAKVEMEAVDFTANLNQTFKKYIESDDGLALSNFETAVIFVLKRKDYFQPASVNNQTESKLENLEQGLSQLNEEIKGLKTCCKQFKAQSEKLSEKINLFESEMEDNRKKRDCVAANVGGGGGVGVGVDPTTNKILNNQKKNQKHSCFIC